MIFERTMPCQHVIVAEYSMAHHFNLLLKLPQFSLAELSVQFLTNVSEELVLELGLGF